MRQNITTTFFAAILACSGLTVAAPYHGHAGQNEIILSGKVQGRSEPRPRAYLQFTATNPSIFCLEWGGPLANAFVKRTIFREVQAKVVGDRYELSIPLSWPKKEKSHCKYRFDGLLTLDLGGERRARAIPTEFPARLGETYPYVEEPFDLTGIVCERGGMSYCLWTTRQGQTLDYWIPIPRDYRNTEFDILIDD